MKPKKKLSKKECLETIIHIDHFMFDGITIIAFCKEKTLQKPIKNIFYALHTNVIFIENEKQIKKTMRKHKASLGFYFKADETINVFNHKRKKLEFNQVLRIIKWYSHITKFSLPDVPCFNNILIARAITSIWLQNKKIFDLKY